VKRFSERQIKSNEGEDMNKRLLRMILWLLALSVGGVAAWAAQGKDSLEHKWHIETIEMGPGNPKEFAGLVEGMDIESAPEWFGQGESAFDVHNKWFHPFESLTFHRVERDTPLPPCTGIDTKIDVLLSKPITAMVAVGHVEHADVADHKEDAHVIVFVPCSDDPDPNKLPDFNMIVRSFATASGGTVSHNGMIHGSGR
jgi:hypothetical protein